MNLENLTFNTFDDNMEDRIGDLKTTDFQPAILNKELIQQCVLENAVEPTVSRQLLVALASPAFAETLTTVIADLTRTDNDLDLFATIKNKNQAPVRLRVTLLTPEHRHSPDQRP